MKKSETKMEQGDFIFTDLLVEPKLILHPLSLKCFVACEVFPVLVFCPALLWWTDTSCGLSGWGEPLPRALLSRATGPRGRARLSPLAACALLFPLHRWTLTCLTSTPARGCWSGSTPTFSTRLGSIPVLLGDHLCSPWGGHPGSPWGTIPVLHGSTPVSLGK